MKTHSYPAVLGALLALGCGNPSVDAKVELLGEENPAVEPGPFHRPGQPCVLCHSTYVGANPELSVGGTIFGTSRKRLPVEAATVKLWDSTGDYYETTTNCIGNFQVEKEKWDPSFPLHVEIEYPLPGEIDPKTGLPQRKVANMGTRISRDGSCAGCHIDNGLDISETQSSPGRVFCVKETAGATPVIFPPPAATCAGRL